MRKFPFKKIDAFATNTSAGNPAGAVYLDSPDDISEAEMQRIAGELKGFVSEVGYLAPLDDNTFHLRYFSSEREVEFCGHATVGIMYDLIKHDQRLLLKERINIVTNKGTLSVENRIPQEDAVFITAPEPGTSPVKMPNRDIAEALNIPSDAIRADVPVSIINAGLETFGYLEDPATGSGNAAFGYYLLQQKQWDGTMLSIEQNGSRERPNIVKLLTRSDNTHTSRIVFGGGAIVRIIGEYLLP